MVAPAPPAAAAPAGRVFWQPHLWTFWAFVLLTAGSLAPWFAFLWPIGAVPWWVGATGVVTALALGVLMVLLVRWLDLYRGAQLPLLAAAFLWGAVTAIGYAPGVNGELGLLVVRIFGPEVAADWSDSLTAPLTEETLKTVGIVAVLLIGRRYLVRPSQGAVVGALCGLGFQLVEDVSYAFAGALTDPASDAAGLVQTVLVRSVTALDSHWLYSAMAGLGVGYALVRRDRSRARRLLVAVLLVGVAGWMHFLSDSPAAGAVLLAPAKLVANLLLGLVIYVLAMRAEWRHFAATARSEPADVITPAEIDAMRGHRSRRRARRQARRGRGKPAGDLTARLQRAQLHLVNDVELDLDGAAPRRRAEIRALRSSLPARRAG